jgi:uncharacterized protein (DUF488 family)
MPTVSSYPQIVGVGYEGQDVEGFIEALVAAETDILIDVRLTPISRKRGFSKRALALAVESAGMRYLHRPSLGNPKANRSGFSGSNEDLERARATYAELISAAPESQKTLDELAELARGSRLAFMCFEADQHRCHRDVVLAEIERRVMPGMAPA